MRYITKPFNALTNLELYQLLQLRQAVFIIEQTCIYPDMDNNDEHAIHLLAFDGDVMVGCLRILDKGVAFDEASIGRVVVTKGHRGRGIAQEMMRQAVALLGTDRGEKRIKLSAQTYALRVYESVGFTAVGEEYLEDDIPHIDMVCTL
ncbi:MAG: GNAT family N-acetyltransferase [Oscillospiraceae bacterium]|nr:GNAT family N-acetyltransferase [Oscillospiraceae bacterium]